MKSAAFNWSIIENMGWAKNNFDYDAIKRDFMETYTIETAKQFTEFVNEHWKELCGVLDELSATNGDRYGQYSGDDSYSDMLFHVIGLGKAHYYAVLENPKLLNDLNFIESFSYAIPTAIDYELLNPKKHKAFAKRAIADIAENIADGGVTSSADYIKLADGMKRLLLIMAGEFTEATKDITFEADYKRFSNFDSGRIHAGMANCIFDCEKYMG